VADLHGRNMLQGMIQDYCTMHVVFGRLIIILLRITQPNDITQNFLVHFFGCMTVVLQISRERLRFFIFTVESPKYEFV